jgi:hypothetical protein
MAIFQVGLAAQNYQDQPSFEGGGGFTIDPVRVKFTFLDIENIKNNYPRLAEKYGTYDSLSCILFDSFQNPILEPIGENI